jgi:hypothetical protein
MDRERKLLYAVVIIAPIMELLMVATWYQPDLPAKGALIEQVHACQVQLFRSWAECSAKTPHRGSI